MSFGKIDPVALSVALGGLSGISAFFIGMIALFSNTGKPINGMMGTIYISYNLTFFQCVLGTIAVLICTFIASYLIALSYNFLIRYIEQH